jgi:hypothetical protein
VALEGGQSFGMSCSFRAVALFGGPWGDGLPRGVSASLSFAVLWLSYDDEPDCHSPAPIGKLIERSERLRAEE